MTVASGQNFIEDVLAKKDSCCDVVEESTRSYKKCATVFHKCPEKKKEDCCNVSWDLRTLHMRGGSRMDCGLISCKK